MVDWWGGRLVGWEVVDFVGWEVGDWWGGRWVIGGVRSG